MNKKIEKNRESLFTFYQVQKFPSIWRFFFPIFFLVKIDEIDKNRKNRESLFTFYKVAQNSLQFDEFLKIVFDVKIDFISFSFFLRRLFF